MVRYYGGYPESVMRLFPELNLKRNRFAQHVGMKRRRKERKRGKEEERRGMKRETKEDVSSMGL